MRDPGQSHPVDGVAERFDRLMPKTDDLTLLILKGHLLVEERLRAFFDTFAYNPQVLADARLSFPQCVYLFQAFTRVKDHDAPIVRFLRRLNELRNRLAHTAEVSDLEARIRHLVLPLGEEVVDAMAHNPEDIPCCLRRALLYAICYMTGWTACQAAIQKEIRARMEDVLKSLPEPPSS